MSDIFSDDALKRQIDRLPDLPPEQGGIGVRATQTDVGVQASVSKQIGKGWAVYGTAEYWKQKGWSAAAWLGWKGTPK